MMTKLWFKTKNDELVDISQAKILGVYSRLLEKKFVVSTDLPCHYLGEFDTKEQAQEYLNEIYQCLIDSKVENAKEEHPWGNFLKARKKAMIWAFEVMGQNYEHIAHTFSMDETQVALIMALKND